MNVMREIKRLNERELELNVSETASWHADYRSSAYIFIGGLSPELSEGDVITMFSQFGEVVDLHMPRRKTLVADGTLGARMGFAFLAYEDQRSTVLAIDNMNSFEMQLPRETRPRTLRVDHAGKYRRPKGAQPSGASGNSEEQAFDDVESNDAAYDARRRAIWDYEKYATLDDGRKKGLAVGEIPEFNDLTAVEESGSAAKSAHASASDSREDAAHADRVLAMLAQKKRERAERAQRQAEEEAGGGGGKGRSGGYNSTARQGAWEGAGAAAASSSVPAAAHSSSAYGAAAAATGSSSSSHRERERNDGGSSHRHSSSSGRRRSSRSRSRSRSRDRKRDRKRSSRSRH